MAERPPLWQLAIEEQTSHTKILAEQSLPEQALEGRTSQEKNSPKHPPARHRQLDLEKLEHMMLKIEALEKVVRKLAGRRLPPTLATELAEVDCNQSSDNNNNNNNDNNNNTTNTNNNNNEPNNYNNNNNKDSREPSLSLDLDNDNPESEQDLDAENLGSFNPTLGAESSLGSLDQREANLSFNNKSQQAMAIGISLGSLIQQKQDEQEGMQIGTAWDPSLMHKRPKKRVSFDETSLAHHKQQNNGQKQAKGTHPRNFQLRQLGSKTEKQELPEQNNTMTTAQTCWNSFQQANLQQQTAPALAKELQHKACQNNSLGREGQYLGSLESVTQTQQACRFPSHYNTSNLGIGTKNTAVWGILVDTGAAISLAPKSFAQNSELSPFESTLQLRSVTGEVIQAFGRRTVQLVCSNFCFCVSFVIANVQHALLGMDALKTNQLSLVRNIFNDYYLVSAAGATTQLHTRGHLLYIEACPEFGFSNCQGE